MSETNEVTTSPCKCGGTLTRTPLPAVFIQGREIKPCSIVCDRCGQRWAAQRYPTRFGEGITPWNAEGWERAAAGLACLVVALLGTATEVRVKLDDLQRARDVVLRVGDEENILIVFTQPREPSSQTEMPNVS